MTSLGTTWFFLLNHRIPHTKPLVAGGVCTVQSYTFSPCGFNGAFPYVLWYRSSWKFRDKKGIDWVWLCLCTGLYWEVKNYLQAAVKGAGPLLQWCSCLFAIINKYLGAPACFPAKQLCVYYLCVLINQYTIVATHSSELVNKLKFCSENLLREKYLWSLTYVSPPRWRKTAPARFVFLYFKGSGFWKFQWNVVTRILAALCSYSLAEVWLELHIRTVLIGLFASLGFLLVNVCVCAWT